MGRLAPRAGGHAVRLRKELRRALGLGHPWVYRDALEPSDAAVGDLQAGEVVDVLDARGRLVARGLADDGPIAVRVWTTADEPLDEGLLARRIAAAAALRDRVVPAETNAYRLLHGEGDRVPGVVCDVYGVYAVLRLDGAGALAWRDRVARALEPALVARGVTTLLLRSGRGEHRRVEAVAVGRLAGAAPSEIIEVRERGMVLRADLVRGQKTGLFLDHRESRQLVRELSRGARVLNLYGYTGGFSAAAALGGARRVTTVDLAPEAVRLAEQTVARNAPGVAHEAVAADVPAFLRAAAERGERWDVVVADPPSFAPREDAVPAALESYRRLHQACARVLAPGGLYLAASCSSHIDRAAFDGTLEAALGGTVGAGAARGGAGARDGAGARGGASAGAGTGARGTAAGVSGSAPGRRVPERGPSGRAAGGEALQVLARWGGAPDHPRLAAFPEGDYLKCALVRWLA
jgi:23S rRNA (cytosine1962-C5)-methyltransferase